MRLEEYVYRGAEKLRCGYTTGSCAAAAAKAAAEMIFTGHEVTGVKLMTPKGIMLDLDVVDAEMKDGSASCAIVKDSGDDPDITNGIRVYSRVRLIPEGTVILGGEGVGEDHAHAHHMRVHQQPVDKEYRHHAKYRAQTVYAVSAVGNVYRSPDQCRSEYHEQHGRDMDMPVEWQIWNVYRSRVVAHALQELGYKVIINVRWTDETSYEFCFEGIESGSIVSVGSHGCSKGLADRKLFESGLEEMIRRIKPESIVIYGKVTDSIQHILNKYHQYK